MGEQVGVNAIALPAPFETPPGLVRLPRWARPWERTKDDALVEAVTLDQPLGTGNNSNASTCSLVTSAAVASGAMIALIIGWFKNDAGTSSITTAAGLTWTKDAELRASSLHIAIWHAFAPSGLASSSTITATISANADSIMGAGSFLGVDTVGTVIASQTNNGSTAGWSSGTVASTSGNMLFGGSFIDSGSVSSSTPTSPGVELFDKNVAGQSETLTAVYKLSVSGNDVIDGTWNAAAAWIAAGVCYKAAAGAATASLVADTRRVARNSLLRRQPVAVYMGALRPNWRPRRSGVLVPDYA
jgi:hypothetical protein